MQLRQPGFTYSVYGPFTKNKERIQNFKETGHTHFYQNELDKACFKHHATDQDFKDLNRRIASDKILGDEELYKILLKTPKMMYIKEMLLQWFITFLIKKLLLVRLLLQINLN